MTKRGAAPVRRIPAGVKAVLVEWLDSVSTDGWGEHDIAKPGDMRCISVGVLIAKTKDRVTLALSTFDATHGQTIEIPRAVVRRIVVLR